MEEKDKRYFEYNISRNINQALLKETLADLNVEEKVEILLRKINENLSARVEIFKQERQRFKVDDVDLPEDVQSNIYRQIRTALSEEATAEKLVKAGYLFECQQFSRDSPYD